MDGTGTADVAKLRAGVSRWVRAHATEFQDVAADGACQRAVLHLPPASQCAGLRLPASINAPAHYAVSAPSMSACIAELGHDAATREALHHVLFSLVEAGDLDPRAQWFELSSWGLVLCYLLRAELVD